MLATLLERSRERGWRVVVQATSPERVQALDDHLWTFSDDSFLPHGTDAEPNAAENPVLLTTGDGNANDAGVRFLVEGAPLPSDVASYLRVVLLFDGDDEESLTHAREQWRVAKGAGHDATYWQQDEEGRWRKRA